MKPNWIYRLAPKAPGSWSWAGAIAFLLVAAVAILPRMYEVGPSIGGSFSLIGQHGHRASDTDFRGKLMLIYFGYTFCPEVCPATLATIARAYDDLSQAEQTIVVPIFVTVDPERDTADRMADYVANFSPALIGLTGKPEEIAEVMKKYRVYAAKVKEGDDVYSVDHSSLIYLVGKDGRFATVIAGDSSAEQIRDTIKKQLAVN